ncbi:hypothetical protein MtrunA17_Chr8g0337181 [Medicago truncatula]|uniref:Uncharacterized protein n=1 Tax=Medicago truncatula TaxID=3880 RepID=A0A396GBW2_MEDTR|nr:hypothetical protein MtrunA17_Chr8g0337181 [Medicago truncatula]
MVRLCISIKAYHVLPHLISIASLSKFFSSCSQLCGRLPPGSISHNQQPPSKKHHQ